MATQGGEDQQDTIENQIVELAKAKPDGISNKDIQGVIPETPAEIWTTIINKLLKNG